MMPTDRDLYMVELVDEYRVLDSLMIQKLVQAKFPGSYWDQLKRRLQKLYQNEFLNRPVEQVVLRLRDNQYHLLYTIGPEGAELLARRRGGTP